MKASATVPHCYPPGTLRAAYGRQSCGLAACSGWDCGLGSLQWARLGDVDKAT